MIEHITPAADELLDQEAEEVVTVTNESGNEELTLTRQELEDFILDESLDIEPESGAIDNETFNLLLDALRSHGLLES